MARPTTPDGVEAELRYIQQGQRIENVIHFRVDGGASAEDLHDLGLAIIDWYTVQLAPQVSSGVSLMEVVLTDLSTPTGPQVTVTTGLPLAGGRSDAAFPMNVSLAVKLLTTTRGRSYRGRFYVCGLTDGMVTESRVDDSPLAALKAAFENLISRSILAGRAIWSVLSEVSDGAPRANGVLSGITTIAIDNTTDSQRRRLPGRGR